MLDPLADRLMLATVFVMLTLAGKVPIWLTGSVIGRDLIIMQGGRDAARKSRRATA
jgi:phosphatidylglycerophosphate synthase